MKIRKWNWFLAVLCLLLLFSCGCGSGSKRDTAYVTAETAAAAVYEEAALESGAGGFYAGGANKLAAQAPMEAAPNMMQDSLSETTNTSMQETSAAAPRKLIRTVSMYVESDSFDTLLTEVRERVSALDGYIERSDVSGQRTNHMGEPYPRSAYFKIRIPSAKLDSFTASVEAGANVINKSENTQDVTLQYSDIESRKKSLTIEQERIWELLEKADSLESVIALEQRLSEIRYELESMESQLRLYDNQVDYSTVDLSIDEVKVYTPTAPETIGERIQNGFERSLENVTDFCVNLFVAVIAGIPIWAPLLFLLLFIFGVLKRRTWKQRIKKKAMEQKQEDTPAE